MQKDTAKTGHVPVIPHIDAEILARLNTGGTLRMSSFYGLDTTHCRAGWAIVLSGSPGLELQRATSTETAGRLIYAASRPGIPAPDFYASDRDALFDMEKCAQSDPL